MKSCTKHEQYKIGSCEVVRVCKYFKPQEACNTKQNHYNWIWKARWSGQVKQHGGQVSQRMKTPFNRKRKVGLESARHILLNPIVVDGLNQKLIVIVLKIKSFFQLTPKVVKDALIN